MRAGKLRHLVTVERATETQDSAGEPIAAWSEFSKAWAAIEPLRGREFFEAQQHYGQVTHRVEIRYLEGIAPKMRVVRGERSFDIQAVLHLEERRREIHLICTEDA